MSELISLREENSILREENAELHIQLTICYKKIETLENHDYTIEDLKRENVLIKRENASLLKRVRHLESENTKHLNTIKSHKETIYEQSIKIADLEDEVIELKDHVIDLETTVDRLENTIDGIKKENVELKNTIVKQAKTIDVQAKTIDIQAKRIDKLEEIVEELQEDIRESKNDKLVNGFTDIFRFYRTRMIGDICDPKLSEQEVHDAINRKDEKIFKQLGINMKHMDDFIETNECRNGSIHIFSKNAKLNKIYKEIQIYKEKLLKDSKRNVLLEDHYIDLINSVIDYLKTRI